MSADLLPGISALSVATGHHVLPLDVLARHNGTEPEKYRRGLGQRAFSVPAPDEDIVTMGAAAALPLVDRYGREGIDTLLFATESGVDQSKSAGVFAHRLLGLPRACRVLEVKQACYAGAGALQLALGLVARDPSRRVLVIAADVARYDRDSPAEPTQGAGACAVLVDAEAALLRIDRVSGLSTTDVDDFWRPNHRSTPIVAGRLSTTAYLDAAASAWDDYAARGGRAFASLERLCFHQPFTKMAQKAYALLAERTGTQERQERIDGGLELGRDIGNSYAASVLIALASLLHHDEGLDGGAVGLFSYGSGAVAEFFSGTAGPGRHDPARVTVPRLEERVPLDMAGYAAVHHAADALLPEALPRVTTGPFRLTGVRDDVRRYEAV